VKSPSSAFPASPRLSSRLTTNFEHWRESGAGCLVWLLQFALVFTCIAFGRIVSDTSFDVSPRNFFVTATVAACF